MLDQAIRAGDVQIGVGGGMESMSRAPYLLPGARFGFRMGDVKALDAMVHDGLTNPFSGKQMFVEATAVADELEITRADLDRWALRSHELALKATDEGRLSEEIVSVTVKGKKGRHRRRDRRGSPSRHLPGEARRAARAWSARRARTPPATPPASTTPPARWWSPPRSGPPPTAGRCSARSSPTRRAATTSPTSPAPPPRPRPRRCRKPV